MFGKIRTIVNVGTKKKKQTRGTKFFETHDGSFEHFQPSRTQGVFILACSTQPHTNIIKM